MCLLIGLSKTPMRYVNRVTVVSCKIYLESLQNGDADSKTPFINSGLFNLCIEQLLKLVVLLYYS